MKINTHLSLAVIAIAFFMSSCSTTYDATPQIPGKDTIRNPFQGDFTATIDGEQFTANTKYITDMSNDGMRYVSISGQQFNYNMDTTRYKIITLSIFDYQGPKTYYLNEGVSGIYSNIDSNITTNYTTAQSDTLSAITITSDQASWQGQFNLMVIHTSDTEKDTMYLSNGQFNIPK